MLRKKIDEIFQIDKLPEEVSISTITIVCKLPTEFNCENIASYFPLEKNGIVNIIHGVCGDIKTNRSIIRKKTRKKKKVKRNFFNQTSLIIYVPTKLKPINVKLFSDGAIQMTGCTSVDDVFEILKKIFTELTHIVTDEDNNPIMFVTDIDSVKMENIINFKISMINSNFEMPIKIDRQRLYNLLLLEGYTCSYDPIKHSCVNIKFTCPEKQVSIFVFETGAIIITGALHCGHINDAYIFINRYLLSNLDKIEKHEPITIAMLKRI